MENAVQPNKLPKKTLLLLARFKLCNRCLARQCLSYKKKIKFLEVFGNNCYLCNNIFHKIPELTLRVTEKIKNMDFDTFLVGTQIPKELLAKEEEIWDFNGLEDAESIKTEINREIGRLLEKKLRKKANYKDPQLTFLLDFINNTVKVQISSIYLYGHYLKLSREISQTKWPCSCSGKGCEKCNNTGKMYTSVEDLLGNLIIKETMGSGSRFHGAGREDVNARMLGNGRAFILEILEPKKRKIILKKLEEKINKTSKNVVQVKNLTFCKKSHIELLKNVRLEKVYRATAIAERDLHPNDLDGIKRVTTIAQKTPTRVLHRRADKERIRNIKSIKGKLLDKRTIELIIAAEAGTYIKELINGDEGRTKPNIAEILNTKMTCRELDVIKIKDGFLEDLIKG